MLLVCVKSSLLCFCEIMTGGAHGVIAMGYYPNNKDVAFFKKISEDFAMGASDGVFQGCIGALDGLAIRIKKPDKGSSIVNPGAYYCQKGFYALNCQAICDSKKRILWMSSAHQGSCHNSTAFQSTVLHRLI